MGDRFVEQHGALESLLNWTVTSNRGPSAALWTLPGFYNGLYSPRRWKKSPSYLPALSHLAQSSFNLPMCVGFSTFLCLKYLLGCWLLESPPTHVCCLEARRRCRRSHRVSVCVQGKCSENGQRPIKAVCSHFLPGWSVLELLQHEFSLSDLILIWCEKIPSANSPKCLTC